MASRLVAVFVFVLALLVPGLGPAPADAHQNGCHRWHSCPSDTGSYTCGDLGYYSECPNKPGDPKSSTSSSSSSSSNSGGNAPRNTSSSSPSSGSGTGSASNQPAPPPTFDPTRFLDQG